MKKILLVILTLISSNLFGQDWDNNEHENQTKDKYKKDYFSIGLYGGGHVSNSFNVSISPVNSLAAEVEYRKSKKWGIFIKGIYEITSKDVKELFLYQTPEVYNLINVKNPNTFSFLFNFGTKYYFDEGKVSPYLQAGFSQDISHMGDYEYTIDFGLGGTDSVKVKGYYNYYLSLDFGVGTKLQLSQKISIDMQFDVYPYLGKDNHNSGYSALIGLKYNIF